MLGAWRGTGAARRCTSISSAATTTSSSTAGAAPSGADGVPIARGRSFERDIVICDLETAAPIGPAADLDVESEIWRALVLGTRDYARKCGFSRAVLGLSGGIDSALTAAIAVEALGAAHVLGRADAVALFEPRQRRRLAAAGRQSRHRDADAADRRGDAGDGGDAARGVRRHRARRHRGKHPGAHPRQPADGAVEQARRAAADDRQQVGAGGRLLHAVRRHVGRPRRDRRRAEDDGVPRGAVAERRPGDAR